MLIFYCNDLILKSRLKQLDTEAAIGFVKNLKDLESALSTGKYTRLIVDLAAGAKLAEELKDLLQSQLETIAVISHVDTKALQAAKAAGFRMIIPRSKFVKDLPQLLDTSISLARIIHEDS